jgi:hypothetical protein
MTRQDADDLRVLADLFRERRRIAAVVADDDNQPPVDVHHRHSRRPCIVVVYRFPSGERLSRAGATTGPSEIFSARTERRRSFLLGGIGTEIRS